MMFEAFDNALLLRTCVAALISLPFSAVAAQDDAASRASVETSHMPAHVRRGLPGQGHEVLKPLEGKWRVEMSVFIGPGTREKPAVSTDLVCQRTWIAGERYLHDVTQGTFGGSPYYRLGLLGYSNVDELYEWVTVDAANSNMMIYRGEHGTGPRAPIEVRGVFTDQGWLGEGTAGKPVAMRTVITIESDDRHTFDLYFTPPGGKETFVDRKVYTRIKQ